MSSDNGSTTQALAIYALGRNRSAPVVYELTGAPIQIGSAEDNHIVLSGVGVEPYHLAVRKVGLRLCALVDLTSARRRGDNVWLEPNAQDTLYCPDHGQLPKLSDLAHCPMCGEQAKSLWLLRPFEPGDTFPIGKSFRAAVLHQRNPNQTVESRDVLASPWPDAAWLLNPPSQPTLLISEEQLKIVERDYPVGDSNLWVWNPPESPIPVFMHQRVNRVITRHARSSLDKEVGGLLLGHVFQDPQDGITYPVITYAIAARFATEARGHLTFTHRTWLDLIRQREDHHPDCEVVGWYHTHPGLDIFLSEWDLMIHRNFFRQAWQVALVVDPHVDRAGFFVWANGDVLDPQRPKDLFRVADLEEEVNQQPAARVRIKLGGPVK